MLTIEVETDLPMAALKKPAVILFDECTFIAGKVENVAGFVEAWKCAGGSRDGCIMNGLTAVEGVVAGVIKQVQVNVVEVTR